MPTGRTAAPQPRKSEPVNSVLNVVLIILALLAIVLVLRYLGWAL